MAAALPPGDDENCGTARYRSHSLARDLECRLFQLGLLRGRRRGGGRGNSKGTRRGSAARVRTSWRGASSNAMVKIFFNLSLLFIATENWSPRIARFTFLATDLRKLRC